MATAATLEITKAGLHLLGSILLNDGEHYPKIYTDITNSIIIARWNDTKTLDKSDGSTAVNSESGVSNDPITAFPDGTGIYFNGTDSAHLKYNTDAWNCGNTETITFFYKYVPTQGTFQFLVGTDNHDAVNGVSVYIKIGADDAFTVRINTNAGTSAFSATYWNAFTWTDAYNNKDYNDEQWHYVEVNYDLSSKVAHVFVDGRLEARTTAFVGGTPTRSGDIAQVWGPGFNNPSYDLKCYMDFMVIYDVVLHTGSSIGTVYYTPPTHEGRVIDFQPKKFLFGTGTTLQSAAVSVDYTGTGTCSLSIADKRLTTSATDTDENIDTFITNKTLAELKTEMELLSYTVTINWADTSVPAEYLNDVTAQDITTESDFGITYFQLENQADIPDDPVSIVHTYTSDAEIRFGDPSIDMTGVSVGEVAIMMELKTLSPGNYMDPVKYKGELLTAMMFRYVLDTPLTGPGQTLLLAFKVLNETADAFGLITKTGRKLILVSLNDNTSLFDSDFPDHRGIQSVAYSNGSILETDYLDETLHGTDRSDTYAINRAYMDIKESKIKIESLIINDRGSGKTMSEFGLFLRPAGESIPTTNPGDFDEEKMVYRYGFKTSADPLTVDPDQYFFINTEIDLTKS
jgi:hypothetical protein